MHFSLTTTIHLLSILTGALVAAKDGDSAATTGDVVPSLNDSSFDTFLKDNNVSLVEFFAPWCGHCQKLEPEYKKAAEVLKKQGIHLANVDCTKAQSLCEKREIKGYPTLKIFKEGKEMDYDGPRDADGIVKYMRKQIMPAVSEVSLGEFDKFVKEEDVAIFRVGAKDGKDADSYKALAESLHNDFTFASIPEGVYMVKKFDEGFAKFEGDVKDTAALDKWIRVESTPLMAEIGPENYTKYMAAKVPMAYLFYEKEEMRKEYGSIVEEAARLFKGKISAVYIDAEKYGNHADSLAVSKKWPALAIHDMEKELKYPFNGKLNDAKAVSKFFEDFTKGKLEPSFRSEEVPKKEEGAVKTVVYKNFEQVVMDPKKDVLLELYAPWCGACKRIAPTYEKLAKLYEKHSDKVIIAKMDGTANDIPASAGIELKHFPTIILFKAGQKKEQFVFEELSDKLKPFVDFITEKGGNKVKVEIPAEESPADAPAGADEPEAGSAESSDDHEEL